MTGAGGSVLGHPERGRVAAGYALWGMAVSGARDNGAFLRRAVFVIVLLHLAYATAGLVANPDFATGAAATSRRLLGVDFNGWHALSGFALFVPGLVLARRTDWALPYALAATTGLLGTGLWALVDTTPGGLLYFPNNDADAMFHIGSAAIFAIVVAAHLVVVGRR